MSTHVSAFGFEGWLYHYYVMIFGDSDFVGRSFSAITGTSLIIIVAEIGRRSYSDSAGLIAASMISASFLAVKYSQEFRAYMIVTLVLWLGLLFIFDKSKRSVGHEVAVIALFCLAFVTHYLAIVVIVVTLSVFVFQTSFSWLRENGAHSINSQLGFKKYLDSETGFALRIGMALAVLIILSLSTLLTDSSNFNHSTWIQPTPDGVHLVLLDLLFGPTSLGSGADPGLAEILWWIILASPVAVVLDRFLGNNTTNIENEPEWLLWSISIGSLLAIIIYSEFVRPLFVDRYMLYSAPAWFLLLGVTMSRWVNIAVRECKLSRTWELRNVVFLLIAFGFLFSGTRWLVSVRDYYAISYKSDFKGMAYEIDGRAFAEDTYIISQPWKRNWNAYLTRMGSNERVDAGNWGKITDEIYNEIETNLPPKVVHLNGHGVERWDDPDFEEFIIRQYELKEELSFTKGRIRIYSLRGRGDGPSDR